jgi:hypothetical protein
MCKNEELQGQGGVEICLESAEPDSVEAVTALPLDCSCCCEFEAVFELGFTIIKFPSLLLPRDLPLPSSDSTHPSLSDE